MVPLRETPMTALSAGPRVKGELIVAMLLGPESCAEPQTPPATPAAERPRRPAPPDRPAIPEKGVASAAGVLVSAVPSADPPAAGAWDPVTPGAVLPAAAPGPVPAGVLPVPAEGPDQPPVPAAVPDGAAVPGEEGAAGEDGAAGLADRVGAGAELPDELGDGAGDDGAEVVGTGTDGTGTDGTGEVGTGTDGTGTEGTGTAGVGLEEMVTEGSGVGIGTTGASDGGTDGAG